MATRKKSRLPRLTVLAYSQREALRFFTAVEQCSTMVHDLTHLVGMIDRELATLIDQVAALQMRATRTNGRRGKKKDVVEETAGAADVL